MAGLKGPDRSPPQKFGVALEPKRPAGEVRACTEGSLVPPGVCTPPPVASPPPPANERSKGLASLFKEPCVLLCEVEK